jgi:hypothetical protein
MHKHCDSNSTLKKIGSGYSFQRDKKGNIKVKFSSEVKQYNDTKAKERRVRQLERGIIK